MRTDEGVCPSLVDEGDLCSNRRFLLVGVVTRVRNRVFAARLVAPLFVLLKD
jgi:hypothetical protein